MAFYDVPPLGYDNSSKEEWIFWTSKQNRAKIVDDHNGISI